MDLIRTDVPDDSEAAAIEALAAFCNACDGTQYCADEADDYFLLFEDDKLLSALMVYHMGDTLDGEEIDEIAAFTLPEERKNGFFMSLLEEALPELRPVIRFSVYDNPDALAVLERLGAFKKNEEILMECGLNAPEGDGVPAGRAEQPGAGACAGAETAGDTAAAAPSVPRDGAFSTGRAELSYRCGAGSVYIYGVSAYERGKGYGTELMEKAADFFAAMGIRRMFLEVSSDNLPAVRLYQKTGFRKTAAVACWYMRQRQSFTVRWS